MLIYGLLRSCTQLALIVSDAVFSHLHTIIAAEREGGERSFRQRGPQRLAARPGLLLQGTQGADEQQGLRAVAPELQHWRGLLQRPPDTVESACKSLRLQVRLSPFP